MHEVTFIVHYSPKIIGVETDSNTTKVKLPTTSRVNPPYLKCIYMVEI